jgi:tetratricopeptide (TPR) repeat protein
VAVTETLACAQITLSAGGKTLISRSADLAPGAPLIAEVALPAGTEARALLLRVCDAAGQELLRYAPLFPEQKPLPAVMPPSPRPEELENLEELYLTGVHVEQYKHPALEPEPYWEKALRLDPGDVRSNTALGLSHLRHGSLVRAEQHFRRAIQTLTRRNPNPRDGEAYFQLGLALKYQGQLDEAYAALYKGIWSYAWQAAGYLALAEIDASRGDFATALDHLDRSLSTNAHNLKARNLKAAALRHLGRLDAAEAIARETAAFDLLDYGAQNELAHLAQARGDLATAREMWQQLGETMRGDGAALEAQRYLDLAYDYVDAGLWAEARGVLVALVEGKGAGQPVYPLVLYTLGYVAAHQGHAAEAAELYARAAQMPPDYCFPYRLQEMLVLEAALAAHAGDARAHYYLGNLLYDKKRHEEAIRRWEAATQAEPDFAIPWRNLGIASYNICHNTARARACYERAFAVNAHDARLLSELDQLFKRLGDEPQERLARLERYPELVAQRDDLTLERATLYNQLGQPGKALEIIMARRFHTFEGGEGRVSGQYIAAHVALGVAALAARHPGEALAHFDAARIYPSNLGEGKRISSTDEQLDYLAAQALAALGDAKGAREHLERAARSQAPLSAVTTYQALALRRLGDEAAARDRLVALRDDATQQLAATGKPGVAIAVPQLVFFEEDPQRPARIASLYLLGLAQEGLREKAAAAQAFREVLALDRNHLGAQQALAAL